MTALSPAEIVTRFFAHAASPDLDDELIAEDAVFHGLSQIGEVHGRDGVKGVMSIFRTAFPNFTTEIKKLLVEGDTVAAWHTHRGIHSGDFIGIPATGRPIEVAGIELFRVKDGQIAEFWHLDDMLTLLQQLGVAPTVGAPSVE